MDIKLKVAVNMLLSSWYRSDEIPQLREYIMEYYSENATTEEQDALIDDMNVDGQPIGMHL